MRRLVKEQTGTFTVDEAVELFVYGGKGPSQSPYLIIRDFIRWKIVSLRGAPPHTLVGEYGSLRDAIVDLYEIAKVYEFADMEEFVEWVVGGKP